MSAPIPLPTVIQNALDTVEPLRVLIGRLWPTNTSADSFRTTLTNIRTNLNQIRRLLPRGRGDALLHDDIAKAIKRTTMICVKMDNDLRRAATRFDPEGGNPSGTRQAISWLLVMGLGQSRDRQALRDMNGSLAKYVRQL